MADVICAHCKREVSRYITDGPYCSLHCRDLAELDSAEKEVEMLREQNALLRKVAEAAERTTGSMTLDEFQRHGQWLMTQLAAARKEGAL